MSTARVELNVNMLKSKGKTLEDTRLDEMLKTFVDNIIKNALDEINKSLLVKEINVKVSSLRLSPGKRSHQDFLDDSVKLNIFSDSTQMERTNAQIVKTPIQKVVDFSPEQRHIWDKENYDSHTKQYSTDRKKKKVKGLSDKHDKLGLRIPLEDITKNSKVVNLDE
jgi:hypothetical protein